jgi:hypothetical protein
MEAGVESSTILMEATHNERIVVDINATVQKYSQFIPSLLALHALTGCDTIPKSLRSEILWHW